MFSVGLVACGEPGSYGIIRSVHASIRVHYFVIITALSSSDAEQMSVASKQMLHTVTEQRVH